MSITPHLVKNLIQALGGHALLVIVKQYIVRVSCWVNVLGLLLVQIHPLLEVGGKYGEVRRLARLNPCLQGNK